MNVNIVCIETHTTEPSYLSESIALHAPLTIPQMLPLIPLPQLQHSTRSSEIFMLQSENISPPAAPTENIYH